MNKSYTTDIIIIGAGVAGLTLALLLAKHTAYRIIVVERGDLPPLLEAAQARVSAVNPLSVRLWQHVDVWQEITAQASPYRHMRVWDHCGGALSFDAAPEVNAALGYIMQNKALQQALLIKAQASSQIRLLTQACVELSQHDEGVRLVLQEATLHAQYLIGSDGAESWVRQQADIDITTWPYKNTAIVANVVTELAHHQTAWQKFTTEGPLAFLPRLDRNEFSIVWSVPPPRAQELLSLSDAEFLQELIFTAEARLGQFQQVSARFSFPLNMRHVKQYVKHRLILCADAAHTVHPMAGQGLNLGMQDVLSLSDAFISATGRTAISRHLRHYERARKTENWQMIVTLEAIKRLYQLQLPLAQGLIQCGVECIDRANLLKKFLLKVAGGDYVPLPLWLNDKS